MLKTVSIPIEAARAAGAKGGSRVLTDRGATIKASLAEYLEGTLRPWRVEAVTDVDYQICGYCDGPLSANEAGRVAGVTVADFEVFEFKPGEILLDIDVAGLKGGRAKEYRKRENGYSRIHVDLDVGRNTANPRAAYSNFVFDLLSRQDNPGFRLAGKFRSFEVTHETALRKGFDGTRRGHRVPRIQGQIPVEIVDVDAFRRWLRRGVGKHKAFGFGCAFAMRAS